MDKLVQELLKSESYEDIKEFFEEMPITPDSVITFTRDGLLDLLDFIYDSGENGGLEQNLFDAVSEEAVDQDTVWDEAYEQGMSDGRMEGEESGYELGYDDGYRKAKKELLE